MMKTGVAVVCVGLTVLLLAFVAVGCESGSGEEDAATARGDDDTGADDDVSLPDDDADDDDDGDDDGDDDADDDGDDDIDDDADDDTTDPDGPVITITAPAHNETYDTHEIPVDAYVENANPGTIQCFYNNTNITSLLTVNQAADRGYNFTITGAVDAVPSGVHRFRVAASNDDGSNFKENVFYVQTDEPYLELSLSSHLVEPGDTVDATVVVYDENGAPISASYSYAVVPNSGWTRNGDTFTFNQKGTYTVTASASYGGKEWLTDEEAVEVKYLTPASVNVVLSTAETQAGTPVVANATVYNADNEPLDGWVVAYTVTPSQGVDVDGNVITITKTGNHDIKGTVQGTSVNETEACNVIPGPPASVELNVSRNNINAGQSVTWSADIVDLFGNEIPGQDATIAVTPPTGVSVNGNLITFNKARVDPFNVRASYTFLYDDESVQVNDNRDPRVVWTTPERGTATNASAVQVTGQVVENESSVASFTINGETPQSFSDGLFSHVVALDPGLNIIVADVEDAFGNASQASISVMRGDLLDVAEIVPDIVGVRVNAQGFDQIEAVLAELVAEFDLTSIIDQLYDDGTLPLVIGSPGESGYVYADFTQIAFGVPAVTITPTSGGLTLSVTVPDIDIVLGADITITGGQPPTHFDIDITGRIDADILVLLDVVAGELVVTVDDFTLYDTQLDVSLNGFPLNLSSLIKSLVSQLIGDLLEEELPGLLEDLLGDLDLSFPVDILGTTFTFSLYFNELDTDTTGLVLWLDGDVTKDAPDDPDNRETCYAGGGTCGSLVTAGLRPTLGQRTWDGNDFYGFGVAVGDDYLNKALYQLFRAGVMNFSAMEEAGGSWDLTIDNPIIQLLVPDLAGMFPDDPDAPIDFVLDPQLPPVIAFGESSRAASSLNLELQMGDLLLDMVVKPEVGDPETILGIAVALRVPLTVSIDPDTQMLSLGFGEPLVIIDVDDEDFIYFPNEALEQLIPSVIAIALPLLSELIQDIPIPTFDGLGLSVIEFSQGGYYNDYLGIFADLVPLPPADADWRF